MAGKPAGRAAHAHDSALRDLYARHGSALLSYLIQLTRGDRHRAEDIVQETLLRAWWHPEAQTGGGWSRSWLFTVARNIAIDQARAAMIRPVELGDDRLDERSRVEDDGIDRLLNAREVRAALMSLPDRLRDVLIEVYFREHSVAEAAQVLGVPPGTVKSRTYYAVRALRDALRARGFAPPAGKGSRQHH